MEPPPPPQAARNKISPSERARLVLSTNLLADGIGRYSLRQHSGKKCAARVCAHVSGHLNDESGELDIQRSTPHVRRFLCFGCFRVLIEIVAEKLLKVGNELALPRYAEDFAFGRYKFANDGAVLRSNFMNFE